jgi:hypothetical protein
MGVNFLVNFVSTSLAGRLAIIKVIFNMMRRKIKLQFNELYSLVSTQYSFRFATMLL